MPENEILLEQDALRQQTLNKPSLIEPLISRLEKTNITRTTRAMSIDEALPFFRNIQLLESQTRETFTLFSEHLGQTGKLVTLGARKLEKVGDSIKSTASQINDGFRAVKDQIDALKSDVTNLRNAVPGRGNVNREQHEVDGNGNVETSVGNTVENLPVRTIAMLHPPSRESPKLQIFNGDGTVALSTWLRKLNDALEDAKITNDTEKIAKLKFHLDGIPRDLVDQVPDGSKGNFNAVIEFLKKNLESSRSQSLAKQVLRNVIQGPNESVNAFAIRLSPYVRSAYIGESEITIMKQLMEEFRNRLRDPLPLLMAGQQYNDFQEARSVAETIEAELKNRQQVSGACLPFGVAAIIQEPPYEAQEYGDPQVNAFQQKFKPRGGINQRFGNPRGRGNLSNQGGYQNYNSPSQYQNQGGQQNSKSYNQQYPPQNSQNQKTPHCLYCGELGHYMKFCNDRKNDPVFAQSKILTIAPTTPSQVVSEHNPNKIFSSSHQSSELVRAKSEIALLRAENLRLSNQMTSDFVGYNQSTIAAIQVKNFSTEMETIYGTNDSDEEKDPSVVKTPENVECADPAPAKENVPIDENSIKDINVEESLYEEEITLNPVGLNKNVTNKRNHFKIFATRLPLYLFLFFATCTLIPFSESMSLPTHPMLCNKPEQVMYWRIPEPIGCEFREHDLRKHTIDLILAIYKLNEIEYSSKAYACQIIEYSVSYWRGPFGGKHSTPVSSKSVTVSKKDCERMRREKICDFGTLDPHGLVYMTKNRKPIEWPLPILSKFWGDGYTETWTECFLKQTSVAAHYGDKDIFVPLGDAPGAVYSDRFANLNDGTAVIWEPKSEQKCRYILEKKYPGQAHEDSWIAKSKILALTFAKSERLIDQECGLDLTVSDQLFAVPTEIWREGQKAVHESIKRHDWENILQNPNQNQHKRDVAIRDEFEPDRNNGIVFSPQLAAELQALSLEMTKSAVHMFKQTLIAVCENQLLLQKEIVSNIAAESPLATQILMNNTLVSARLVRRDILEMWTCLELKAQDYTFVKASSVPNSKPDTCFDFPPLIIRWNHTSHAIIHGFRDPITGSIAATSKIIPCEIGRKSLVYNDGKWVFFDQITGEYSDAPQPKNDVYTLKNILDTKVKNIDPVIFYNLVMYNASDFFKPTHAKDLIRTHEFNHFMHLDENGVFTHSPKKDNPTDDMMSILSNRVSAILWNIWCGWISVVCIYSTLQLFGSLIMCCAPQTNFANQIWSFQRRRPRVRKCMRRRRRSSNGYYGFEMSKFRKTLSSFRKKLHKNTALSDEPPKYTISERKNALASGGKTADLTGNRLRNRIRNSYRKRRRALFQGNSISRIESSPSPTLSELEFAQNLRANPPDPNSFEDGAYLPHPTIEFLTREIPIHNDVSGSRMSTTTVSNYTSDLSTQNVSPTLAASRNSRTLEDSQNPNWPPVVRINAVNTISSAYTAVAVTLLNNMAFMSLIDTGAAICVASSDLITLIRAEVTYGRSAAVGVGGEPLSIIGRAIVNLTIGNVTRAITIHFTDDEYFSSQQGYNVIIGCDALRLFPPLVMDLARGVITINGQRI
uniref:CCHC-type domain-containing protein n=1 Tax=Acrobeloides nanus TaxID=290746 RepID=A0A914E3Z4_9BILA